MKRLQEYIKQIRGISYSPSDITDTPTDNYLPVLKANNIQDGVLDLSNLIYIHKDKIKAEQLIKKGDILIAASSGSKEIVGKSVYFETDFNGSFGAFCKVIRPQKNIYAKFVSVFFKTPTYRRHIRKVIQGANINNLRTEDIDSLKIPEFKLEDQIRIATILSKAEALIQQRKESIALLDDFLKSTFLEMFGDPVKNEKGWEKKRLSNFIIFIRNGLTRRGKNSKSEKDIVLRLKDIKSNSIDYTDLDRITLTEAEKELYKIDVGDLLFIRVNGNPEYVGRCAISRNYEYPLYHNDHIIRVKINQELLNPFFLSYFLNMEFGKSEIAKYRKTSAGQHTINQDGLNSINLFVPAINRQNDFVQIVEKTELLKKHYQTSLTELENLFGALSQKAFKGELDLGGMNVEKPNENKKKVKVKTEDGKIILINKDDIAATHLTHAFKDVDTKIITQQTTYIVNEFPKSGLISDSKKSLWKQTRSIVGKTSGWTFTPHEGIELIEHLIKKEKAGFNFEEFLQLLKTENFKFEYKEVKNFFFKLLEDKKLRTFYANKEWMKAIQNPKFNPPGDFAGDGNIWFVYDPNLAIP